MNNFRFPAFLIAFGLSLASLAVHGKEAIEPGAYIGEGGSGTLSIKRKENALMFKINAVGANGHTCDLDGEIKGTRATLKVDGEDKPCIVNFLAKKEGIEVGSSQGVEGMCRMFCGARAYFDGLYLKPAAGCDDASRSRTRKQFKSEYDSKDYAKARATLEPLIEKCGKTLHWVELGYLSNDLAITQYKLQDFAGCLRTLQDYAADAKLSDKEVQESMPPFDGEMQLKIVRAARTNIKLCQKGSAR